MYAVYTFICTQHISEIIFRDLFPPLGGVVMPRHINNFYLINDRDDELIRSSDDIIESGSLMTLHCTENLQSVSRVRNEPESFTLQSVTLTN